MNKIKWIKDLVLEDQDAPEGEKAKSLLHHFPQRKLEEETLSFLKDIKLAFIEVASVFNQMKGSTLGNLKIYGISKTKADFMLFRNHLKLNFEIKQPGTISISFHTISSMTPLENPKESVVVPQEPKEFLKAQPGAFEEFHWFCRGHSVNIDSLVRYYLRRFIRQSALKSNKLNYPPMKASSFSSSPSSI